MERLHELRREIDLIDRNIAELIGKRVKVAREIGRIKKELGMRVEDAEREREIISKVGSLGEIFRRIIEYCKNEERH